MEKISNNPLLATNEQLETLADLRTNMKNSAKEYLSDKTGERKAERKDVPAGGLTGTERFPMIGKNEAPHGMTVRCLIL